LFQIATKKRPHRPHLLKIGGLCAKYICVRFKISVVISAYKAFD